jgi:outer membrane protein assembly factor BamB
MHIYQKLRIISAFALTASLSACAIPDWLGAGESEPKLIGDRFEVMSISSNLKTDDSVQSEAVDVPAPSALEVSNLYNNGNYTLLGNLSEQSSISFGDSADEFFAIISAPISADGKIFVVDGSNTISALNPNLKQVWATKIESVGESGQGIPAGISYKNGKIFATTGFGVVAAINAADGKILWQNNLNTPIRSAPAVDLGEDASNKEMVFITTADNKTFAFSAEDGSIVWRHSGIAEVTRKFATASPVAKNNLVATSYASGEIFGINANKGREVWAELLSTGLSQTKAASGLNDVSTTPLIVDGIIYATSAGGKFAAINFGNGSQIWEQPIFGVATPWVAERYIFVISDNEDMIAMNRYDGRIKWIKPLRSEEQKDDSGRAKWQGPILASGNLIAHNNLGDMILIEPNSGNTISRKDIPEGIYAPASVIGGKLYLVTRDADLVELR